MIASHMKPSLNPKWLEEVSALQDQFTEIIELLSCQPSQQNKMLACYVSRISIISRSHYTYMSYLSCHEAEGIVVVYRREGWCFNICKCDAMHT